MSDTLTEQQLDQALYLVEELGLNYAQAGLRTGLSRPGFKYRYTRAVQLRDGIPPLSIEREERHRGAERPWHDIASAIILYAWYDWRSGRPCHSSYCKAVEDGDGVHRCADAAYEFLMSDDASLLFDLLGYDSPETARRGLGLID